MAPEIQRESPSRQVARFIRQEITDGRLRPGDKAPTVRAVMETYQVAYATAHRAIKMLQSEGYLTARPGRSGGNFVTSEEERSLSAAEHADKAARTGLIYPEGQYAVITDTGIVEAPDAVAAGLDLETGAEAIYRKRVRFTANDRPSAASTSWFAASLAEVAPKLLERDRIPAGTFAYVAQLTGRVVAGGEEQVSAIAADEEVATLLQIEPGTPVVASRTWLVDAAGDPIEYGESYTAGRLSGRWGSKAQE
jgi:GntR family transcriptional regulator